MPRPPTQLEALSPGQLARRWGIGVDRVRRLVESGKIPGAFRIPAVGRYGEAVKIPLAAVLEQEQEWAITPMDNVAPHRKPRGRRGDSPPTLRHFPELNHVPEPDVGCSSDAPH